VDSPMTFHSCDILATMKRPSSLQGERSLWLCRGSDRDHPALLWILSTGRVPLLWSSQKQNSGCLLLLLLGRLLLKAGGTFLEPTKASSRIPPRSVACWGCPGVYSGLPYCHMGESVADPPSARLFLPLSFCTMIQWPFCPQQKDDLLQGHMGGHHAFI
jgi:hypothetical protein